MNDQSTSNKLWHWVVADTQQGKTRTPNTPPYIPLSRSELKTSAKSGQWENNELFQFCTGAFSKDPMIKLRINNSHLTSGDYNLNKYDNLYRDTESHCLNKRGKSNNSINTIGLTNENNNINMNNNIMVEKSMLAYSQKMQELANRKQLMLSTPEGSDTRNNSSSGNGVGTGRRWAMLQRLRRQAVDLRSMSDSNWGYGTSYQGRNNSHRLTNSSSATPPNAGHLSGTEFGITNKYVTQGVTHTPAEEEKYLESFSTTTALNRSGGNILSNGYDIRNDYLSNFKLKSETNVLTLPGITQSLDSFNIMDSSQTSVQISPFPGIELQAIPAKLHSQSAVFPPKRNPTSGRSVHKHRTIKNRDSATSNKSKPLHQNSGKLAFTNRVQHQQPNRIKNVTGTTISTDIHDSLKPVKLDTPIQITQITKVVKNVNNSNMITRDFSPKAKRPSGASLQKSKVKASQKQCDAISKLRTESTHTEPPVHEQNNVVVIEKRHSITNSVPTIDASNIKSVLKKTSKSTSTDPSIASSADPKITTQKKSVQFGTHTIREVTKIVYPWNRASYIDSDDEDIELSDDIEVDIEDDDGDSNSDDSFDDCFDENDPYDDDSVAESDVIVVN